MASINGSGLNGPHLTNVSGESLIGLGLGSTSGSTKEADIIKVSFATREGVYRALTSSDYRPVRIGNYGASQQASTPVKVSFISSNDSLGQVADRICFNIGRELFVFNYKGVKKQMSPSDQAKPIDKRIYKGTFPTCHDFSTASATIDSVLLLIGFSAGQVQLIDPIKKEFSKLYNEERLIDKTKVTCIKWLPFSSNVFYVSHASGQLYVYKEDLTCGTTPPNYQLFKSGDGFNVYTCKAKSTRNPLYRWVIGESGSPINEFAFSPDGKSLATVSQDGFLRVFNYNSMELLGRMRSYFGGLLCLSWSPDGNFIAVGGEDDLITIWSMAQKRVVARGQGHKSWVSVIAFDPYTTSSPSDIEDDDDEDEKESKHSFRPVAENRVNNSTSNNSTMSSNTSPNYPSISASSSASNCVQQQQVSNNHQLLHLSSSTTITNNETPNMTYRIGSVGQDGYICLWELSDDVLRQPVGRSRTSIIATGANTIVGLSVTSDPSSSASSAGHTSKSTNEKEPKEHKRNFSLGSRSSDKNSSKNNSHRNTDDPLKLLGTGQCPRLEEVPMLEPLICKRISYERLTVLAFREDCFVTACHEGFISTWARPGHGVHAMMVDPKDVDGVNFKMRRPSSTGPDCDDATIV